MKLTEEEIKKKLDELSDWDLEDSTIRRKFKFSDFSESIDFVNQVAEKAEEANHHPDILIQYNVVMLTLTSHDAGGLTDKDFSLARKIDLLDES